MTKKVHVIFHNLRGYDSHLIIKEINRLDVKVTVIPNGLEKNMAFTINRNLGFIGSMQWKMIIIKYCVEFSLIYFVTAK